MCGSGCCEQHHSHIWCHRYDIKKSLEITKHGWWVINTSFISVAIWRTELVCGGPLCMTKNCTDTTEWLSTKLMPMTAVLVPFPNSADASTTCWVQYCFTKQRVSVTSITRHLAKPATYTVLAKAECSCVEVIIATMTPHVETPQQIRTMLK